MALERHKVAIQTTKIKNNHNKTE